MIGTRCSTAFPWFESYPRIDQPRPEERAFARVSKDGHKRDRASGHPSRRRFAPPQDEVFGYKLNAHDPIGFMESIDQVSRSSAAVTSSRCPNASSASRMTCQ